MMGAGQAGSRAGGHQRNPTTHGTQGTPHGCEVLTPMGAHSDCGGARTAKHTHSPRAHMDGPRCSRAVLRAGGRSSGWGWHDHVTPGAITLPSRSGSHHRCRAEVNVGPLAVLQSLRARCATASGPHPMAPECPPSHLDGRPLRAQASRQRVAQVKHAPGRGSAGEGLSR